jgi:hypothetical protein
MEIISVPTENRRLTFSTNCSFTSCLSPVRQNALTCHKLYEARFYLQIGNKGKQRFKIHLESLFP